MNCYQCKYHGSIPGDAHYCCRHPSIQNYPLGKLISMFVGGMIISEDTKELNIKLNPHGVKNGWCYWPINYDPTWVDECDGFIHENNQE